MNANALAELIILVADEAFMGRISIDKNTELNRALWKVAGQLGLELEVDNILQNTSMDKMMAAMKEMGEKVNE